MFSEGMMSRIWGLILEFIRFTTPVDVDLHCRQSVEESEQPTKAGTEYYEPEMHGREVVSGTLYKNGRQLELIIKARAAYRTCHILL